MEEAYKIIRFRRSGRDRIIKRRLTLEEAQRHCQSPKTHGEGWFDGYTTETYKIIRFRQDGHKRVVRRGLTLAEAQAHCASPNTRGNGWFDGFDFD